MLRKLGTLSLAIASITFFSYKAFKYTARKKRYKELGDYLGSGLVYGMGRTSDDQILIINSIDDISSNKQWLESFISNCIKFKMIGFDCEWVGANRISLIQIAEPEGMCLLFRSNHVEVPDLIGGLLNDHSVIKLGVGISDDVNKLRLDHGVEVSGWVDIRHLAKAQRPQLRKMGLAGITKAVLDIDMDKDWKVRASNWEATFLSSRQIKYGCNDAYVAVSCVISLVLEKFERGEISDVRDYNDLVEHGLKWCTNHIEIPWTSRNDRSQYGQISSVKPVKTSYSKRKDPKHSARKRPLYCNAYLEAPDGQQLCVCDERKAAWYVQKGLGEYVSNDPLTVRVNFEPAGRPVGKAGDYYLTAKSNVCVVCGKDESYLRKYIVPHEYRTYFPEIMRDHQSHDVLLMCIACHQIANIHDNVLRRKLAAECNAPIGTEEDVKVREDYGLKKVRSAGRALLNDVKCKIPLERREQLKAILTNYYGAHDVTQDIMRKGANLETNIPNDSYVPHAKKVVDHFVNDGGLIKLEVRWRQHFLDVMKPRFLPPLWSVNHQRQRLDVKAAENRIDPDDYRIANGN